MLRLFRHYIPTSLLFLGAAEVTIMMASLYAGVNLRFWEQSASSVSVPSAIWPSAALLALVNLGAMTFMGLYWRGFREGLFGFLLRIVSSLLITLAVMSLMFYLFPTLAVGRGVLAFALLVGLVGLLVSRFLHYVVSDHDALNQRVLVLGTGVKASELAKLRRKSDWRGYHLVGFVHIRGQPGLVDKSKVLHADKPLQELVDEHQVDEIVVAIDDRRKSFPVDEILECKMSGIEIVDIVTFFEQRTGKIKIDALHPSTMIFSDGFQQAILKRSSKRVFDVVASLLLLAMVWPFMLLTALAIFLESGFKGPIFYRQVRVGRNGAPFAVLKFRSMRVDAEKHGAQWAKKKDDRVTKVGGLIRKFRIDELPQLLNVFRGDMSFVGPRPERPEFVGKLAEEIPFYNLRHKVKPGITGWAQICYPYGDSAKDALEKLQYDLYYIKNYSWFFDLTILFQTAQAVFWGRGGR